MAIAEIITIGTELLLGDTQDTNTHYIASRLKNNGFDLFRTTIIGDNPNRIAELILESLQRADIVITTGGLGPTIDDPTREAVSMAMNKKLVFHEDLWQQIQSRFHNRGAIPSENNKKQAYIPEGAVVLENQYGTAPAFIFPVNKKFIICLPGVPKEMELLFEEKVLPFLKVNILTSRILVERVLHTVGIGESTLDALISEYEKRSNPTVGLTAYPGLVDIRIVASADKVEAATHMVNECHTAIQKLIPNNVYGTDNITLPEAIRKAVIELDCHINLSLFGFPPGFTLGLSPCEHISLFFSEFSPEEKNAFNNPSSPSPASSIPFSFVLQKENDNNPSQLVNKAPGRCTITKKYLGPPVMTFTWFRNTILYFIWSEIKSLYPKEEKNEQS
jgi:competence/damage-inducible protein CinA-like protein